ncbi:replication initiation protein [Pseudomonas sp. DG56-2]|uniref:replication initiation protein n=1 Tax=Pseudomonas sp. DG56-2 TaxID=2320270 RepID=UPI0010A655BD|nr:replication initiation protein [Pseudomonas sp. DG56-2]
MEYIITRKERRIASLEHFISLPKIFLALPFFTPKNTTSQESHITVAKFGELKDIKLKSVNLSVITDFEVFLFLMKKAYEKKSNTFEFDNFEIYDYLKIKSNHRDTFFKSVYLNLVEEKLSSIDVSYSKKNDAETSRYGFKFIEYRKVSKKKTSVRLSKEFIEFFNGLEDLYEISRRVLNLLSNEYQRILYILYICNRRNTTNYFSVDDLRKRFSVTEKMPNKTFVMKIRDANKALQALGFISGFKEDKGEKANGPTIRFLVDYTYKTLYSDFGKKRAAAELNLSAFNSTKKIKILEAENLPKKIINTGDDEWI